MALLLSCWTILSLLINSLSPVYLCLVQFFAPGAKNLDTAPKRTWSRCQEPGHRAEKCLLSGNNATTMPRQQGDRCSGPGGAGQSQCHRHQKGKPVPGLLQKPQDMEDHRRYQLGGILLPANIMNSFSSKVPITRGLHPKTVTGRPNVL